MKQNYSRRYVSLLKNQVHALQFVVDSTDEYNQIESDIMKLTPAQFKIEVKSLQSACSTCADGGRGEIIISLHNWIERFLAGK